jgi:hypothetical protein
MTPVTPLQQQQQSSVLRNNGTASRKRKRGLLDSIESSAASEVKFHEEDEFDKFSGEVKKVIVIDDDSTPEPSPPANLASVAGRLHGGGLRNANGIYTSSSSASTSIFSSSNGSRTASFTAPHATLNGALNANHHVNVNGNGNANVRQPARTRAQVAAATAALKENAAAAFQAAPPPPKRRRRDPQAGGVSSSTAGHTLPTRKPFPQITNKPWPSTSTDTVRLNFWITFFNLLIPVSLLYLLPRPKQLRRVMIRRVITLSPQTISSGSDVSTPSL